jgi:hypothetical protein
VPERIQLKRTPGWRLGDAVVVTRATRHWGNPFKLDRLTGRGDPLRPYLEAAVAEVAHGAIDFTASHYDLLCPATREVAVAAFRLWLAEQPELVAMARSLLRGRDLACVCPLPAEGEPDICHGAVWLEVANSDVSATLVVSDRHGEARR